MKRYSGLSFAGVLLVCLVMTWSSVQAQGHFKSISFENHGAMLQGGWYPAPSRPAPTVILLHGFPGGKGDVLGFGEVFQKAGWNALSGLKVLGRAKAPGRHTTKQCIYDTIK